MTVVGIVIAVGMIVAILVDAFEVMILPRRVRHSFRLARQFYRSAWIFWRAGAGDCLTSDGGTAF